MKRLLTLAAVVATLSCRDSTAPGTDLISISVLPDALEIVNVSHHPVYFFATERNSLALMLWAPCTDPDSCEGIPPGESKVVPYTEIAAWSAGAQEAVVHHWHLVRVGGASGFKPDSIRSTVVRLHTH
jgi:hypothetical protein